MSDTVYRFGAAPRTGQDDRRSIAHAAKRVVRTAQELLHSAFRSAHYDTPTARKNPRPIRTWTPNGWC